MKPLVVTLFGKVYDATAFSERHPGGPELIRAFDGQDASDAFIEFHHGSPAAKEALSHLPQAKGASLAPGVPNRYKDFTLAVRNLRAQLQKEGAFNCSFLHFLLQLSILACLAWLGGHLQSAFLLGLFNQQMGWMGHEVAHRQVLRGHDTLRRAIGTVLGGIGGFAVCWWNEKHYMHHAKPNVEGGLHSFLCLYGGKCLLCTCSQAIAKVATWMLHTGYSRCNPTAFSLSISLYALTLTR
jgi:acyl-lipid Delta6-acetylenase / acyl-lipid (9-3)-desaturase